MTILKQTRLTGAAGDTITTSNTGFDSVTLDGSFPELTVGGRFPFALTFHYYDPSDSVPNYGSFTGVTNAEHYGRCYAINLAAAAPAGVFVRATGRYIIAVDSANRTVLYKGDASSIAWQSSTALSSGTEYRFEWHHTVADGKTELRIYTLDGTTLVDSTGPVATTTSTTSNTIDFGNIFGGSIQSGVIDDGIAVGDAAGGWLGPAPHNPYQPTWTSPADGTTLDRAVDQTVQYAYSSPDSDTQSQRDYRTTTNGGATWTETDGDITTSNQITFPGGTFSAGGVQVQVRTYGASGVGPSPWSPSLHLTFADVPAGPTITSPTSGAAIDAASVDVTFSYPTLQQWQWRVLGDTGGVADPAKVIDAGATVTDKTARSFTATGLPNGQTVHIQVRVFQGGLWSTWVDQANPVAYSPPPAATVTLSLGSPNPGAITINIVTAAPGAGEVAATSATVQASPDGGATVEWQRSNQSPTAMVPFYTPTSDVDYAFQVTTYAASGASTSTGWLYGPDAGGYGVGLYGEGLYGAA